jgi:hypothetical protein
MWEEVEDMIRKNKEKGGKKTETAAKSTPGAKGPGG